MFVAGASTSMGNRLVKLSRHELHTSEFLVMVPGIFFRLIWQPGHSIGECLVSEMVACELDTNISLDPPGEVWIPMGCKWGVNGPGIPRVS